MKIIFGIWGIWGNKKFIWG